MARRNWEEEYSPDIVEAVRNRDYANGGADAVYMNDEDYAATLYDKSLWGQADEAGRSAIHDRAEQRRAGYGYSGGSAGDEYNKLKTGTNFSFQSAPQYISRYQDLLDQLTQQYVNRGPFEYDYATDPRWQAYKKEYTREGRRATEDTLGQYAAMTGGVPSTAAMTAASQAGDYYNARMTDKIPELAQLAYDMYLGEGNQMLQKINALQGMEQADYNQYLNALGQWNTDRNFAYQDYLQGLADERSADGKALAAAQIAGGLGNYGLLENYYGIDPGTWQSLYDAQVAAAATGKGGSGGSSGGRGGSGSGGGIGTDNDESDIFSQMRDAGVTASTAFSWLQSNGITNYNTAKRLADDYTNFLSENGPDDTGNAPKTWTQKIASIPSGYNDMQVRGALRDLGFESEDDIAEASAYYKMLEEQRVAEQEEQDLDEPWSFGGWLRQTFGLDDKQKGTPHISRDEALNMVMVPAQMGDDQQAANVLAQVLPQLNGDEQNWLREQLRMFGYEF